MAGNKYEKYLNDKKDSPGVLDAIGSGLKTTRNIVGAAALIGGGYSGIKKLKSSGALDNIASGTRRFLGSDTFVNSISTLRKSNDILGAYAKGFDDTVKSSGLIRTLTGKSSKELHGNLTEHLARASSGITRDISSKQTNFERLIAEQSKIKSKIGQIAYESTRLQSVRESVDFSLKGYGGKVEQMDTILKNIVDQEIKNKKLEVGFENNSDGHNMIKAILKKHNADKALDGHDFIKAQNTLMRAFTENVNTEGKFIAQNKGAIGERLSAINTQYENSIKSSLKKEGKLGGFIEKVTGYKRVRVGEAIEGGLLKRDIPNRYKPIEQHTKQYMDAIAGTGKNLHINDSHRIGKQFLQRNKDIADAYIDPLLFRNRSGKVLDARFLRDTPANILKTMGESIQVPFVNIKPFRMASDILGLSRRDMPGFEHFERGAIMPTIERSLKKGLSKDHLYFNGKLVDDTGKLVEDNAYIVSAKFGPWQRVANAASGNTRHDDLYSESKTVGEYIKKNIFSFGYQEFDSDLKRKGTFFTKFKNKDWGRNILDELTRKGSSASAHKDDLNKGYRLIHRSASATSSAFDRDVLGFLEGNLKGVLSDDAVAELLDGPRDRSVISAIQDLIGQKDSDLIYDKQLKDIFNDYMENPETFDRPFKVYKNRREYAVPDMMESVAGSPSDVLTKMDEAEKILHSELLHQIETKNHVTIGKLTKDMYTEGYGSAQIENVKRVNILKELQSLAGSNHIAEKGYGLNQEALNRFSGFVQDRQGTEIFEDVQRTVYDVHHKLGYGPGQKYSNIMQGGEFSQGQEYDNILPDIEFLPGQKYNNAMQNSDYMLMRRSKKLGDITKDVITRMNEETTLGKKVGAAGGQIWADVGNQLGFGSAANRAGRNNMDKMTTASYVSYFFGFRLNEGISKLGLGMSVRDMGSAQDIWKNLGLKRLGAPLVAISAARYLDDEVGNLTGEKPSQSISKGYATTTVGVQTIKEITGINALGEDISNIMPGITRLGETPAGRFLNKASFGIIGDTRSPQELLEYYKHGSDPIRKSRFWSIGSNTPVYGDRIKYYEPNWYRQSLADPMMTDVMYGSTGEYWANHWMPNPRNLMGFLKPGRRSHWENKHYDSRPYPVSSTGMEEIPLVGPILDGTIGRIIKPFRRRPGLEKAHREYLTEVNELIRQKSEKLQAPGYIYTTPGGRMTPSDINYGELAKSEEGLIYADRSMTSVSGYAGGAVSTDENAVTFIDPNAGFVGSGSGAKFNQAALTDMNTAIINKRYITARDSRSLQSLRNNIFVENLAEAVDPNSLGYRLGKTYYSTTELAGIYGFASTTLTGDYSPDVSLQSSIRMMGFERKFWDRELGGLGGELSEIGRRFIPHRDRQSQEYNPFKNTMPSWLPGPEYFQDFRHGDPYVKIQKGELRLPGAGYEALNKLHPDQLFGRYGALDRMKILADVAPYSEQYRYYTSVVSRMHNEGMISDEDYSQVSRIKEQVTNVKKKYDLHPYKFRNADINQEEVTVRRWIDANTFLTYEHPGTPIKLAGIKMPGLTDESDGAKQVREMAERYISPGQKIRIGIESDALNRVKDDTMESMDAVVYDSFGDSVNARLAKQKPMFADNPVEADYDDTSATSVNALYSSNAITVGKVWEKFAHMDTPFHTKFLQIRSPLEMYKRKELYGKNWQSWGKPMSDFIVPMMDKHISSNPLMATARGAAFGYLIGAKGRVKKYTAFAAGLTSGVASSVRTIGDFAKRTVLQDTDATWVPKRRREQREIDEYFDFLKYVKYKGLYEKARRMAITEEGIDPQAYIEASENQPNGYLTDKLSDAKRWLKINKSHYYADGEEIKSRLNAVNQLMNDIAGTSSLAPAGPYVLQALKYREEYQSTLYGVDPSGDFNNIYRALPKKDRPFFKEFMLANPEEREEILRLVPENQKRIYQAKWGLKVDKKPSLSAMAARFALPGDDWDGWSPDHSMDEIKIKFLHNKGLELGEFGYWKDDIKHAKNAPEIPSFMGLPFGLDKGALEKALKGAGISNIDIIADLEYSDEEPQERVNIGVNMLFDRRKEAVDLINANMSALI